MATQKKLIRSAEQLWLPGMEIDPQRYFRNPAGDILGCGYSILEGSAMFTPLPGQEYPCSSPSLLLGLFFRYGSPIRAEDLKDPTRDAHLIGLDSLFPDSDHVFACGVHIGRVLQAAIAQYELLESPHVIVNALWELEENLYRRVLERQLDVAVPDSYFTAPQHSRGRENLRELWAREQVHFKT